MAIDIRTRVSNYIPLFYLDVITYPSPNIDVAVVNLCWLKMPLIPTESAMMQPDCTKTGRSVAHLTNMV